MANECEYHLMAVGKKKASLDRLLSIMRNEDAEFYIYRVFSADVAEDGEEGPPHKAGDFWSMEITGTVAWSCAQWVEDLPQREIKSDNGATYTNLPTLCKMLNVAVEIWAEEEEIGFQQHIVIDNKGAVIKNDEEDYTYIYGYDADSYVSEGGFNDYRIFVNPIEEIWSDTDTLNGSSPAKTPAEEGCVTKNPVAKNRFTEGFWEYETETNVDTGAQSAIITGMKGKVRGSIKIPAVINKIPVTGIGARAFCRCKDLRNVKIPNNVTSIGAYAFFNCSDLTSVTIPDGVTDIGRCAFCECDSLTSVTIPNSVTTIGDFAFCGCCGLTSVVIPDSVENIGSDAFRYCSGLTSVTISGRALCISPGAFSYCEELTSVLMLQGVSEISEGAFYCCSALTSVTIPNSVTSIELGAFEGCSGLKSVSLPRHFEGKLHETEFCRRSPDLKVTYRDVAAATEAKKGKKTHSTKKAAKKPAARKSTSTKTPAGRNR